MVIMDESVDDIFSNLPLPEIIVKCPPEITTYLSGALLRFNQSSFSSFYPIEDETLSNLINNTSGVIGLNQTADDFTVTDWSSIGSSAIATPAGILRNHHHNHQHQQQQASALSHQEDMQRLKYYSYGIALPTICVLGILGNVLNLIVLTRPSMRGPAYVYMRGNHTRWVSRRPSCLITRSPDSSSSFFLLLLASFSLLVVDFLALKSSFFVWPTVKWRTLSRQIWSSLLVDLDAHVTIQVREQVTSEMETSRLKYDPSNKEDGGKSLPIFPLCWSRVCVPVDLITNRRQPYEKITLTINKIGNGSTVLLTPVHFLTPINGRMLNDVHSRRY